MKVYYVYTLLDPRSDEVFYIGMTSKPKCRLSDHWTQSNGLSKKDDYISEMREADIKPHLNIIDTITSSERYIARVVEQVWIKIYLDRGYNLTNETIPLWASYLKPSLKLIAIIKQMDTSSLHGLEWWNKGYAVVEIAAKMAQVSQ